MRRALTPASLTSPGRARPLGSPVPSRGAGPGEQHRGQSRKRPTIASPAQPLQPGTDRASRLRRRRGCPVPPRPVPSGSAAHRPHTSRPPAIGQQSARAFARHPPPPLGAHARGRRSRRERGGPRPRAAAGGGRLARTRRSRARCTVARELA